jgi:hypothetical protein
MHILPLPSLFIYEILVYIKSNSNDFVINSGLHLHNTRKKDDLYIVPYKTSLCKYNFNNVGLRLLNHLPQYVKEILVQYKFENALKTYLLNHCFYSMEDSRPQKLFSRLLNYYSMIYLYCILQIFSEWVWNRVHSAS